MKKFAIFIILLHSMGLFAQDVSFSKPGKNFYNEMSNPDKSDPEEWSNLPENINISFASDNIRYPKEKDIFDYCLNIGQTFTKAELEQRKKLGKPATYYTACGTDHPNGFTYSPPAENVWISWYAAAAGFTGYLRWAYNNWVKDPLLDSRFRTWPAGDLYQIYPGPRSSIRFEKFIEGIQNFEKISLLREQFINQGKFKESAELDVLLSPFTIENLKNKPAADLVNDAKRKLNKF